MSIKTRIKRALFGFLKEEIQAEYSSTFAHSTVKIEQVPFEVLRFEGKVSLSHLSYGEDPQMFFERQIEEAKMSILREVENYIEVETADILDSSKMFDRAIRLKLTVKNPN